MQSLRALRGIIRREVIADLRLHRHLHVVVHSLDVPVEEAIEVETMTQVNLATIRPNFCDQLVNEFGDSRIKAVCFPSVDERNHTVANDACKCVDRSSDYL